MIDDKESRAYFEALEQCQMVDSLGIRIPGVDVSKLPRKFLQVDAGEGGKWAKGSVHGDDGKMTMGVRGIKSTQTMVIDGSPSFHFQKHNVVSSADAVMLQFSAAREVNRKWGTGPNRAGACQLAVGKGSYCTRIDTPVLVAVPPGLSRAAVINGLGLAGVLAGVNTALYVGESVYFDQDDQQAALKAYDKVAQMASKRRRTLPPVESASMLEDLAARTIRLEGVFRLKYLHARFGTAPEFAQLHPGELAAMFIGLLDRYELRRRIRRPLNQDQLLGIPRYRHVVEYWQRGYDVLAMLNNNRTEYSRAKSYLATLSIYIDQVPPTELAEEVEVGDLLRPENFVPVPDDIRRDPYLFHQLDMDAERQALLD
jgi:Phage replication protein CRI